MTTEQHSTAEHSIEPLLVRVEDAARILALSRSTVYELIASGQLPTVKHGAARRVPVEALKRWVADRTMEGA